MRPPRGAFLLSGRLRSSHPAVGCAPVPRPGFATPVRRARGRGGCASPPLDRTLPSARGKAGLLHQFGRRNADVACGQRFSLPGACRWSRLLWGHGGDLFRGGLGGGGRRHRDVAGAVGPVAPGRVRPDGGHPEYRSDRVNDGAAAGVTCCGVTFATGLRYCAWHRTHTGSEKRRIP